MKSLLTLLAAMALASISESQACWPHPDKPLQLEIDYMNGPFHSHAPSQLVLDAVEQMFACQGIDVVMELSNGIGEIEFIECPDLVNGKFFSCEGPSSFDSIAEANFDHKGEQGWHYILFGHKFRFAVEEVPGEEPVVYENLSGVAPIPGKYALITMGAFPDYGTPFDHAATFAHELGHALGLEHYSWSSSVFLDTPGPLPANYPSIMSYRYQLNGVANMMECQGLVGEAHVMKQIDYSGGRFPTISEIALSESLGLGIHPVDWDCDEGITAGTQPGDTDDGVSWCNSSGDLATLRDQNDWAVINDTTWCPTGDAPDAPRRLPICSPPPGAGPSGAGIGGPFGGPVLCTNPEQPTLTIEPRELGRMVWVDPNSQTPNLGTDDAPYDDFLFATVLSTNNSALFLQPGTYAGSGPMVIDRPFLITGPGSAVIDP